MPAEVRARVLQIFEKHRATPGAPYDERHFLDFLLAEPKNERALYDSFRGLRRFNAFLDEVQYELGVCFSLKDREANYPLDKFVTRAIKLQQSPRGSLTSLKNQTLAGPGWGVLFVADFVLLVISSLVSSSAWALTTVIAVAVVINLAFLRFAWRARSDLIRLRKRLEGD